MKKSTNSSENYKANSIEGMVKQHPIIQINHIEDEKSSKGSLKSANPFYKN